MKKSSNSLIYRSLKVRVFRILVAEAFEEVVVEELLTAQSHRRVHVDAFLSKKEA